MMVKLGIKSVPGNISSMKLPKPPNTPFHPPNVDINTIEEIGPKAGHQIHLILVPRK